jgi:chromatin remodeling complex protein RSC6
MQTRSGNVYTYALARPQPVEPKVEKKVAAKVEKKVAPKAEKKVAPKVEPNVNNSVNASSNSSTAGFVSVRGSRVISGFIKPCRISDELAKFLNVPVGSLMLRTDVSKLINSYIRANNLQDPANGRKINPDAKFRKLLNIPPTDELTYFNLQKYMKHHFIRDELNLNLQDIKRNELLKKY